MDPLNRSISKLKPPSKIVPTTTPSSALSTALAVAASYSGDENKSTAYSQLPNTTTMSSGMNGTKRKAEETALNKRAKGTVSAPSKPAPLTSTNTQNQPMTRRAAAPAPTRTTAPQKGTGPTGVSLTRVEARSTAGRIVPGSSATSARRPNAMPARAAKTTGPSTSRTPSGNSTRISSSRPGVASRQQQPSPSPSSSSLASDAKGGPSSATALNNADILDVLALPKKKKRPAWDTKGRLEDMEELTGTLHQLLHTSTTNMSDLTSKLESSESKISELESFRQTLQSKVAVKEIENKDILQKMHHVEQDLQMTARQHADEIRSLKAQHSLEMEQLKMTQTRLKQEMDMLENKLRSTNTQLESQMQENMSLRSTISTQSSNCLALESDNRAAKLKIERTEKTLAQRESTIETLERQLSESQLLVKDLEQRIRNEESIRRRLHNTIQELKGNIRVFCRVRPATTSKTTKSESTVALIKYPDQEGREIEFAHATESATGNQTEKRYPFTFDKVFQPSSKQEDVFEEISQLVQSALDGYNVCIFAYGQTGSGKTHTMEGPLNASGESMGMIPRSVLQIYQNAKALEEKGWKYTMEGQYVEIYNETIIDLLGNDGIDSSKKHEIRHGPNGKTTITDVTTEILTSPQRVATLLKKAAHNRTVGSTQMNERSSRSHCVFTLRLAGKNSITDESSEGVLNLIDLAGSERLSQSGATGDRLRETQAINKSLSCLGDVIYAISNKDQHIPYRNSKLTYLLQNSLGGNSKTLMFVNVSPLMSNFNETLCSLRFATKVNACTIGTATKRAVKAQ
ncbi:kinesin family member C1 [Entomortierella parvispora]|uniref:Kinesin-like protein n=1 Tax=Entomortierella parvispora TaxID=205924 RepID=A0A9P3H7V7_9FUNG|nr:kinesin family member C1 [Entomortierella parvispora]